MLFNRTGKEEKHRRDVHEVLHERNFFYKLLTFPFGVMKDFYKRKKDGRFNEYGMTTFVGRQGSGKTMSMVVELERIRRDHPKVMILTNFGYKNQHLALTDWQQLIDVRSEHGIVFAIDEIQNEFDVYDSRNFNLEILKVITQQRKQGIKILSSSQVFTRVSKPLREQAYEVVECYTVGGRWTFNKCFDAHDYNLFIDQLDLDKAFKVPRKWRRNYIQTDSVRDLFDSYAVIESMTKLVKQQTKKED